MNTCIFIIIYVSFLRYQVEVLVVPVQQLFRECSWMVLECHEKFKKKYFPQFSKKTPHTVVNKNSQAIWWWQSTLKCDSGIKEAFYSIHPRKYTTYVSEISNSRVFLLVFQEKLPQWVYHSLHYRHNSRNSCFKLWNKHNLL